jgi:hypothetical protein
MLRQLIDFLPYGRTKTGPGRPIALMHIAKTAGTAARLALMDALGKVPQALFYDPKSLAQAWSIDPWSLAGNRLIAGHFGTAFIDRFEFPCFKATFVRDPVERTLSHYVFTKTVNLNNLPPDFAARLDERRNDPLEDLLKTDDPFWRAQYENHQAKQFAGKSPLDPGAEDEVYGDDLFERARAQATAFDMVGIQEHFSASMEYLFVAADLGLRRKEFKKYANASDTDAKLTLEADKDLIALIKKSTEIDQALYDHLDQRFSEALAATGVEQ